MKEETVNFKMIHSNISVCGHLEM